MKKSILALFALLLSFSSQAIIITDTSAGTDNGTDVGSIDTLIATTGVLGSTSSEETWVNAILAPTTVEWTIKESNVDYFLTNLGDVYAFDLIDDEDYFIVKNSTTVALFQNLLSTGWGVFDASLASLSDANLGTDPFQISHVTSFNSGDPDPQAVPEPTMPMLLGIGLALLGSIRLIRKGEDL